MSRVLRLAVSLVVGIGVFATIGAAAFAALRVLWPEYATAETQKEFTLAMLLSRLAIGALCTAGAACITALVARDYRHAAWWLGGVLLMISLPIHLYYVWNDFPWWYHAIYLLYLVPIAGFAPGVLGATTKRSL